jgi:chemotaxis protein histidine kinase CheA
MPGVLSREEERTCWIQKVTNLDQQVHCLEQAAFFGRLARHCDALLQPLDFGTRGAEIRGAGTLRQPEETEPRLAKSEDHEHQRTQLPSALPATHVTSGANAEPESLQESPRPQTAVLHGTLRQPEKTEPGLAKSEDHEHQRTQLPSQAHATSEADTEPEMVPDAEFLTVKSKTGSRYWRPEHVDPEGSLDENLAETLPPRPAVEPKEPSIPAAPKTAKKLKNKKVASHPERKASNKAWDECVADYVKDHESMRPDPYAGEPLAEGEAEPRPVKVDLMTWEVYGPSPHCRACELGGPQFDKNFHTAECRKRFAYLSAGKCWPPVQAQPALVATSEPDTSTDLLGICSQGSSSLEAQPSLIAASANLQHGERLYRAIAKIQPQLAGEITGMLLELGESELLTLLASEEQLREIVNEIAYVTASSPSNGKDNTGEDKTGSMSESSWLNTPGAQERQEGQDIDLWHSWNTKRTAREKEP